MAELGLSRSSWGFDPRSIPRCLSWIDAADRSSLTTSGNNVTSVRDKANYANYTVTNTITSGLLSLNGNNLMNISSNAFLTSAANTYSNAYRTLFFVGQIDASSTPGVNPRTYFFMSGSTANASIALYYWHATAALGGAASGVGDRISIPASNIPSGFFNSSFILCYQTTPTGNSILLNGTALTPTTNIAYTLTTGSLDQIVNPNSGPEQKEWRLGEMLLYDDSLTSGRRQIIEGYLAWKWGLSSNLPASHPYRTSRLFGRPFVPSVDLTGCILWLDAADRSNVILSGSNVSQMTDKSGSNNHAVQATSSNQPVFVENVRNGLPIVRFSGTNVSNDPNSRFLSNVAMSFPNAPYTIFVVAQAVNNTVLSWTLSNCAIKPHFGDFRCFVGSGANSFTTFVGSATSWNDVAGITGGTQPTSNWTVFTVANTGTVNGLLPYITGDARTAKNGTTVASTGYTVGDAAPPFRGQNWNGDIGEILVFNRDMSFTDRYLIEGYLAWKWGITTPLPASHSYTSNRLNPQSTAFQVLNISNLILWLDGTDPCGNRTTVPNGTNLTTWFDKSGSNNHMTASEGTPTYSLTNSAAVLGGSAALLSSNVTAAPFTAFFVYTNYNGGGPLYSTYNIAGSDGFRPNNSWDSLNRMLIARSDGVNFSNWYALQPTPYPLNRRCMATIQYSGTAIGSTITGYLDASQVFTSTTTGTITRLFLRLAKSANAGDFVTADYNEVLYYSRILTTAERQAVEGNLAWKWKLVSFLPSNHPYKNISP